jgi:hypothetical protein
MRPLEGAGVNYDQNLLPSKEKSTRSRGKTVDEVRMKVKWVRARCDATPRCLKLF